MSLQRLPSQHRDVSVMKFKACIKSLDLYTVYQKNLTIKSVKLDIV